MSSERLPSDLAVLVPSYDSSAPAAELADGRWAVAGAYAFIVVAEDAVVDSGMWYEIARVRWNAETRELTAEWVDPARPPLAATTVSEDPKSFMRTVTERVDRSLVMHKSLKTASGTTVTAWIRRREDDALFSVLTCDGPLDASGRADAERLERTLREGVGLD